MYDVGWFQLVTLAVAVPTGLFVGWWEYRQALDLFDYMMIPLAAVGAFPLTALVWWVAALTAIGLVPLIGAGLLLQAVAQRR